MKRVITSIIIISFILLISGCLDNESPDLPLQTISYDYWIIINSNETNSYEVNVPIFVTPYIAFNDDNISEIIEGIIIHGDATTSIINTMYGKALNIIGRGVVEISSKGTEELPLARPTLLYDSDNDGYINDERKNIQQWIYCNSTSPITIEISCSQQQFSSYYLPDQNLEGNGWCLVDARLSEGAP